MTRILGIDPGSRYTGYGIIDCERGRSRMVVCGRIAVASLEMPQRLLRIRQELAALIAEHAPAEVAIEEVFVNKNVQSALVLGQARGVAMLAAAEAQLPLAEYAAAQVKLAVTGSGRADKEQVQQMVKVLLNARERLASDASDALAIALTHAHVRATHQRAGMSLDKAWGRA
ncbi:MAG TPA: crossover junction endodeoxyribonuclease RuvC [Solimonas sp.]|nr:crossover junction endodeoxyribonuclease RuvC [Solimonas sp.]